MTQKEWLLSLPDEEYLKQTAQHSFKCDWCFFWRDGKCHAGEMDTCMRGRLMWLKQEHKQEVL